MPQHPYRRVKTVGIFFLDFVFIKKKKKRALHGDLLSNCYYWGLHFTIFVLSTKKNAEDQK